MGNTGATCGSGVEDALPVKVWHERYPGGNIELMTPDEDGCYTIPADYDVSLHHDIFLEDACGNKTYYNDIDILWNYLEVVREKDYWDVQPAQPIRISGNRICKRSSPRSTSGFLHLTSPVLSLSMFRGISRRTMIRSPRGADLYRPRLGDF